MDDLPESKSMKHDDALAELAERYFKGHGPAILVDFVWWSGLLVTEARKGLDRIKSQLRKEIIDNKTYWIQIQQTRIIYIQK